MRAGCTAGSRRAVGRWQPVTYGWRPAAGRIAALHAVAALLRRYTELCLLARARDERHAQALKGAGATEVVSEAVESGVQLACFSLTAAGMPIGAADFHVDREREELRAKIDAPR